jgi:hypothetical protein
MQTLQEYSRSYLVPLENESFLSPSDNKVIRSLQGDNHFIKEKLLEIQNTLSSSSS